MKRKGDAVFRYVDASNRTDEWLPKTSILQVNAQPDEVSNFEDSLNDRESNRDQKMSMRELEIQSVQKWHQ